MSEPTQPDPGAPAPTGAAAAPATPSPASPGPAPAPAGETRTEAKPATAEPEPAATPKTVLPEDVYREAGIDPTAPDAAQQLLARLKAPPSDARRERPTEPAAPAADPEEEIQEATGHFADHDAECRTLATQHKEALERASQYVRLDQQGNITEATGRLAEVNKGLAAIDAMLSPPAGVKPPELNEYDTEQLDRQRRDLEREQTKIHRQLEADLRAMRTASTRWWERVNTYVGNLRAEAEERAAEAAYERDLEEGARAYAQEWDRLFDQEFKASGIAAELRDDIYAEVRDRGFAAVNKLRSGGKSNATLDFGVFIKGALNAKVKEHERVQRAAAGSYSTLKRGDARVTAPAPTTPAAPERGRPVSVDQTFANLRRELFDREKQRRAAG